jgi:isoquinoline 1-oxidoreductase
MNPIAQLNDRREAIDWADPALDYREDVDLLDFRFDLSRRQFVGLLGAGLLIAVLDSPAGAQQPGGRRRDGRGRGGGPTPVAARLHIGADGTVTLLNGKVECGQGARAELTQAAAEELRLPPERITVVMADTALTPNDGGTSGSRSTPSTVPAVRQAAATARTMLVEMASQQWNVPTDKLDVRDGKVIDTEGKREVTYGELATNEEVTKSFQKLVQDNIALTPIKDWKTLGTPVPRPNKRDIVTGKHQYPSDIVRPNMLYGKVLRAPSYGAKLLTIDLEPAKSMQDVVVVRDGDFIGVCAPTKFKAAEAIKALADAAKWETAEHPSSEKLFDHLARGARGGRPKYPFGDLAANETMLMTQNYSVAYAQHAPLEPRAAVAEWTDGKLTVWTATQNPFNVRSELARAFRLGEDAVRVIIPDFGGGFGGKHSGETAVEAARLAQTAGRPVSLQWTRQEEFTWAYFRPAAVINVVGGLDKDGAISSWFFVNINSGGSALESPYKIANSKSQYVESTPPLRHGSYRALASTANNFARESFMDELAAAAGRDPLEFRLAHLENGRLRAVLEEAARKFDWPKRSAEKNPNVGVGLACGTEKGSYVAACVEVEIDPDKHSYKVRRVCQAYECGKILNPKGLLAQVEGAIIQGLGPAMREQIEFEGGRITNAAFSKYHVPRFEDVPALEIHLLDRPDLPSVGAGETPIIAVAPAIANAIAQATGERIREMPIRMAGSTTQAATG